MTKEEIQAMAKAAEAEAEAEAAAAAEAAKVDYTQTMIACAAVGCDVTGDSEERLQYLTAAIASGVGKDVLMALCNAIRVSDADTIVLPRHHYETLSRGRGWCRMGKGDDVVWGKRHDDGYEVGPGVWHVGGSDGFRRKDDTKWIVEHVEVGNETWTIAN